LQLGGEASLTAVETRAGVGETLAGAGETFFGTGETFFVVGETCAHAYGIKPIVITRMPNNR
jgi:hypothetical protein